MSSGVSKLLKDKRKELGLSVKEVLGRLLLLGIDISDKTLYGWESGHRQPDADTFLALCQVYGINTFSNIKTAPLYSSEAMKLAKDYDELDRHGKEAVRKIADVEMARHKEETSRRTSASPIHGFDSDEEDYAEMARAQRILEKKREA